MRAMSVSTPALVALCVTTRALSTFPSFFFNDTATTEIYTLSLHDALPIYLGQRPGQREAGLPRGQRLTCLDQLAERREDRKSTRLNSSHGYISYAVFCLKKKKRAWALSPVQVCTPSSAAPG